MYCKHCGKEYTNDDVYDFLAKECRYYPELWKEFGEGILSRMEDADFWNLLSEHLDCLRVCDECGKPMIVGYVIDGCNTYCSDECLHKHLTDQEYKDRYADGNGDTYWTVWYEDSITFKNVNK